MATLAEAAAELGKEHGKDRALAFLHLKKNAAKKILEGYDKQYAEVMDLCPNPLSGEWVDDPSPLVILERIADKVGMSSGFNEEADDDLLDVYQNNFEEAFWESAIAKCKEILGYKQ